MSQALHPTRSAQHHWLPFRVWGFLLRACTCLQQAQAQNALEIFKLSASLYLQSADAYDSLGELYTTMDNHELARKNYQRALALNPKNMGTADYLKKSRWLFRRRWCRAWPGATDGQERAHGKISHSCPRDAGYLRAMKNQLAVLLLVGGLVRPAVVRAQARPRPAARAAAAKAPERVYSADEVMPCSFDVLTATELIQSRAVYPADFLKTDPHGEVHLEFVVDGTGKTREVGVRQHLGHEPAPAAATTAVLAAVQDLPRLQPALREGKPVAVRMGLTIRYPNPPPSKMYTTGPNRVYAHAEQMPQLLTGGGGAAIVTAIQQHLEYPAAARAAGVAGRVYVRFVVGADGKVHDAQVLQGIGHGCDEAALAAVQQLPEFRPGRQNGCPVAVAYTAPLLFGI